MTSGSRTFWPGNMKNNWVNLTKKIPDSLRPSITRNTSPKPDYPCPEKHLFYDFSGLSS